MRLSRKPLLIPFAAGFSIRRRGHPTNMHSPDDYTCSVDGCDAARRSGRFVCGAHWGMVPPDLRAELAAAGRNLHRAESALARHDSAETHLRMADAFARLEELQIAAVAEVEMAEIRQGEPAVPAAA